MRRKMTFVILLKWYCW